MDFFSLQDEYVKILHKKVKGGKLTDKQKEENRALASEQIVCENVFAGMKRYRLAAEVHRNRKDGFDDRSIFTAVGLCNFYAMAA